MTSFDVGIVGGGPAGLSAALVLSRCCRSVIVFDHGRPRNKAAKVVNCYLAGNGMSPADFRDAGRKQATAVGAEFIDAEVTDIECLESEAGFEIHTSVTSPVQVRKLLLATGVHDELPELENIGEFYGTTVHHCPYCDGWEHRGERLVALGDGEKAFNLALELQIWSPHVTACTSGHDLTGTQRESLERNGIACRFDRPVRLDGRDGRVSEMLFDNGPALACDALFFASAQVQRSHLPQLLGCQTSPDQHVCTARKQGTGQRGLFVAGDADGDVQFAIVAAAEGAIAATAINTELREDELRVRDRVVPSRRGSFAQT